MVQYDENTLKTAASIFERNLGYSVSAKEYTEHLKIGKYGFELSHTPFISLVSVQARTDKWGAHDMDLGQSVWIPVPLEQTQVYKHDRLTLLQLPPTLFGTNYTEVQVTYLAGLMQAPSDVKQAVETIATLIHKGEIDDWNCQLPLDVLEVIDSYRKEDK